MITIEHSTVFAQDDIYAGWPANHGAWQWGDEFLVGFMQGPWCATGMHNICEPMVKKQARSLDGGKTWVVEDPGVDFEARTIAPAPPFSLKDSIIRVCGVYDHGGEACDTRGGFYLSKDRGHTWEGAYSFGSSLFDPPCQNTSRTAVLGDLVFVSAAIIRQWGSDYTFCMRHTGSEFLASGVVCKEWFNDNADPVRQYDPSTVIGYSRCVMPAVAQVDGRIVACCRRRDGRRTFIDSFGSDNDGRTWKHLSLVSNVPTNNGNPPALLAIGNRLVCAYGHRSTKTIRMKISADRGETWGDHLVIRKGQDVDIGYPRLFARPDSTVVCVYYWSDAGEPQRIEATAITGM